jgi:hypothetical protein
MAFVEFLEGFARICDKAYIVNGDASTPIVASIETNILKILSKHNR